MATIRDNTSGTPWGIDTSSNAGRVTLYDTSGNPLVGTEDSSGAISLSALSATVEIEMSGHNSCGFDITNIGSAGNIITAEATINGTWVTIPVVNSSSNNTTPTITEAGTYTMILFGGITAIRLRMSTYVGGTATGTISAVYLEPGRITIRTFDNVLSVLNSTTAQLSAGATFTGTWEADLYWQGVTCNVFADQPLTITIEQSIDGVTVTNSNSWTYNASSTGRDSTKSVNLVSNFHRVKITNNGSGATTTLAFQLYACPNFTAMPISQTALGAMPVEVPEQHTYRAAVAGFTPIAGLTFSIKGSATRIVKVTRWGWSGTNSNLNTRDITIKKYSAVATGTAASVTMLALDSNSPAATALVQSWSVAPGTQTSLGIALCERYNEQTTGSSHMTVLENGNNQRGTSTITLRGTSQWAGIDISAVTNSPVYDLWVEWIEI